MIAKTVFNYLEPYLPYQIVYGISMIAFIFERFIMPKVNELYSNASLDPKTLVPFIFSAIALYLSIVSIYHVSRAAFRMLWFLLKWSLLILIVWFGLAIFNDFKDRSYGGSKIDKDLFLDYQNSLLSWWKNSNRNSLFNFNQLLGFDPLQFILGHGLFSRFDSFFNHFHSQSQNHHPSQSSFNPNQKFSPKNNNNNQKTSNNKKTKSSSNHNNNHLKIDNLPQFIQDFWLNSVLFPIQSILNHQSQFQKKPQTQSRSETHNR